MIGIFGLAWLGDTFIKGNEPVIIGTIGEITSSYPITFALGLFFASVLLFSQAATTRALMPLGISLGHRRRQPHCHVAGRQRLFLPADLRVADCRHQFRPHRHHPHRAVRAQSLLHASGPGIDFVAIGSGLIIGRFVV